MDLGGEREAPRGRSTTEEVAVDRLDERYGRLRIVDPAAERAVRASLLRLGQLTPIVVAVSGATLSLVDGFKRLHAARELELGALHARVMPLGETAAVAAVVTLNRKGRGVTDLEEALVVRTLCREHGLEQSAVAALLGRHKSWVCRRLSLVERLAAELTEDVRAGLCSSTMARELSRLPRGNQIEVALAIRRHALSCREAARLIALFAASAGEAERRRILEGPREALEAAERRARPMPFDPSLGPSAQGLYRQLERANAAMDALAGQLDAGFAERLERAEREVLRPRLSGARNRAACLAAKLACCEVDLEGSDAE